MEERRYMCAHCERIVEESEIVSRLGDGLLIERIAGQDHVRMSISNYCRTCGELVIRMPADMAHRIVRETNISRLEDYLKAGRIIPELEV